MSKFTTFAGAALATALTAAGVYAQPRQRPVPAAPSGTAPVAPPAATTAPPVAGTATAPGAAASNPVRAKQVIGATISLQGGASAGTVDDIVMNQDGVVEYLIVNNGSNLVSIPWEAAQFNWQNATPTAAPTAVINLTADQYKAVPTFTATTYPNFYAPAYRAQVYKFYNLTPGQERRLDRRDRR